MANQLKTDVMECTLTNFNVGQENHGKEKKVMRLDLDYMLEAPPTMVDKLVTNLKESFEQFLYDGNGNRVAMGVGVIPIDSIFKNHKVVFNYSLEDEDACEFTVKKIHKFRADFKSGDIAELKFQVQIRPSEDEATWLLLGYMRNQFWQVQILGDSDQGDWVDENDQALEDRTGEGQAPSDDPVDPEFEEDEELPAAASME